VWPNPPTVDGPGIVGSHSEGAALPHIDQPSSPMTCMGADAQGSTDPRRSPKLDIRVPIPSSRMPRYEREEVTRSRSRSLSPVRRQWHDHTDSDSGQNSDCSTTAVIGTRRTLFGESTARRRADAPTGNEHEHVLVPGIDQLKLSDLLRTGTTQPRQAQMSPIAGLDGSSPPSHEHGLSDSDEVSIYNESRQASREASPTAPACRRETSANTDTPFSAFTPHLHLDFDSRASRSPGAEQSGGAAGASMRSNSAIRLSSSRSSSKADVTIDALAVSMSSRRVRSVVGSAASNGEPRRIVPKCNLSPWTLEHNAQKLEAPRWEEPMVAPSDLMRFTVHTTEGASVITIPRTTDRSTSEEGLLAEGLTTSRSQEALCATKVGNAHHTPAPTLRCKAPETKQVPTPSTSLVHAASSPSQPATSDCYRSASRGDGAVVEGQLMKRLPFSVASGQESEAERELPINGRPNLLRPPRYSTETQGVTSSDGDSEPPSANYAARLTFEGHVQFGGFDEDESSSASMDLQHRLRLNRGKKVDQTARPQHA
jgi:hypothetical protein